VDKFVFPFARLSVGGRFVCSLSTDGRSGKNDLHKQLPFQKRTVNRVISFDENSESNLSDKQNCFCYTGIGAFIQWPEADSKIPAKHYQFLLKSRTPLNSLGKVHVVLNRDYFAYEYFV
jgi:hypothetical protein